VLAKEKMGAVISENQSDETKFEETISKQVEGFCEKLNAEIQGTQFDIQATRTAVKQNQSFCKEHITEIHGP
jgi:hypothetical protein